MADEIEGDLTDDDVRTIRRIAAALGDRVLVNLCDTALDPDARSFIRRRARELIGAVPVFAVIVEHECEREYEFDSAEREHDFDPAKVN